MGEMNEIFFSNGKYGTVDVEQNANNVQFSWGVFHWCNHNLHLIRSVKLNDSVKVWFLVIWVCCWKMSLLIVLVCLLMFLLTTGESPGSSFRLKWTCACKLLTWHDITPAQETIMDCTIIINKYISNMFTMRCSNKLKQEWSDFFVDGTTSDTHSSYTNLPMKPTVFQLLSVTTVLETCWPRFPRCATQGTFSMATKVSCNISLEASQSNSTLMANSMQFRMTTVILFGHGFDPMILVSFKT